LFYFDGETALVFSGQQLKKGRQLFLRKKVHPGDLAGGFSDLEMTWLLYCTGADTATLVLWYRNWCAKFVCICHIQKFSLK